MYTFRIFVSSPGDVAEERLIARRVIERLRGEFAGTITVDPIFWEHEPLAATASFQDQLPHPSDAHAVVCILWSRLGTRLPPSFRKPDGSSYSSGTEFEFEDALAGHRARGWPALLVYRKTAAADLAHEDEAIALDRLQQKQALDRFVRRWFHDETDGTLRAAFHPFETSADFEEVIEIHLRKLIARQYPEATGETRTQTASWHRESPFRGLQAFEYEHAPVFFGRTAAITDMLSALRTQSRSGGAFLLVLGASGSGKSSVVRAGLLPVLTQPGVIEGVATWQWASIRPRDASGSLESLALQALHECSGLEEHELKSGLAAQRDAGVRIALFVDQLEEVFSAEDVTPEERDRFFELLHELSASGAVWVIATLRSDFYPRVSEVRSLVELKAGAGQYDLLPPSPAEIGQMIRLPAAAAGLRYEVHIDSGERLDEVLRDAAVASPESLPLLEFALEELYKRRASDGTLTFAAYRDIGGVEGALAQRAEEVFQELSSPAAEALPAVLRKLIAASAGGETFSRRSARQAEFDKPGERTLVEALVAARLCISELDSARQPVVSIAHEALLRHWPRVRHWLEENHDLLRARARLAAGAERWAQESYRADLLLAPGRALEEAKAVEEAGIELSIDERALLEASTRRATRARRLRLGAVGALALLAIAATSAAFIATSQRQRALDEAATSKETMDFMVGLFTLADPTEARANEVTVREILDRGAQDVRRQLRDRPAVRSNLMTAMGRAYTGLGLPAPATTLLKEALAVRESVAGSASVATTETRSAMASALYLDGKYEAAEREFRLSLEDARQLSPQREVLVANILNGWGSSLSQLGRDSEAEQAYREALDIDRRHFGEESLEYAQTQQGLAEALYFMGRYPESHELFVRNLAIQKRLLGEPNWKVGYTLNQLGALSFQMGSYDEAVRYWKQSLDMTISWAGDAHPDVGSISNNIGRGLLIDGELDEAQPYLQRALDIHRRTKDRDHDDLILPLNSLGMIDMAQGRYPEAEAQFVEALRIAELQKHWMLDQVLTNLADLYAHTGRAKEAPPLLDRARTLLEAQYPLADMPDEAWRYALQDSVRASVYTAEKNYPDAEKLLVASLPVIEARFGAQRFYTTTTRQRLADLYRAWGKPKLAARYAR